MNYDLTSAHKDLVIIGRHVLTTHRENFILQYDLTQHGLTLAVFDIGISILGTPTWVCQNLILSYNKLPVNAIPVFYHINNLI